MQSNSLTSNETMNIIACGNRRRVVQPGQKEMKSLPLRILQVIHGYPMRYNAGSEVYTQGLAQALAERHEVHVFTRQENAFLPEYDAQRGL